MSLTWPKIRLTAGDTVIFDGEAIDIRERARDGRSTDRFVVDGPGGVEELHVDWFTDRAERAGRVVIERE